MGKLSKIKQSKVAINTTLSTRKSESQNSDLKIFTEDLQEISIEDLKKSNFTYGGAFPYLTNALSQLCTINPKYDDGEYVIKGQDDNESTHYSAILKWESLVELATDNDPLSKDMFRHEIMKIYKTPPNLYINLNNGYSILTHPFIIRSIVYEDRTQMSAKDAEICARLGITKKISHVDIEFIKPMFAACIEKNNHGGFIWLDPAFYAKEIRTIEDIRTRPELLNQFKKFYNPRTNQYILKAPQTYYKYILYFLTHISENDNADYTTINAIEMLRHVDPSQLQTQNGKDYIKNKYDTKLFMDKAGMLYNTMAQLGYCEYTVAVIKYCTYDNTDNYRVYYQKARPRTNIESYTSNFIESEVNNNEPMNIEKQFTKRIEGRKKLNVVDNDTLEIRHDRDFTQDNFGL